VAIAMCAAAILIYLEGRRLSFFYDEWNFILERRGNDLDAFLAPHNAHLNLLPILVYRALFATVGLDHYGPYRLAVIALHLVCAGLFFVLLRRRCDRALAALATVLVLFLGTAWQDLLWPFQITYLGSIAAGLGAFIALERRDRRGDIAAACLLTVSWACSGLGIPFLLGALADVAWDRARVRRAWVVVAPGALYGLWYLAYGESETTLGNARHIPAYVADALAGTLGGITGLGTDWGRPLAAIVGIALVAMLVGSRPVSRSFAVFGVTLLSFWVLTALTRGELGEPDASRYIYPGALLLLLVGAELAPPGALPARSLAVVAVLVLGATVANVGALRDGASNLRDISRFVDAELAAVELEGAVVPADYQPDPDRAPVVTAGPYLAAVAALGSPADPAATLTGAAPDVRAAVDRVFAGAGVAVEPGPVTPSGHAPAVDASTGARAVDGPCVLTRGQAGATLDLTASGPIAVLPRNGATVEVAVRRVGDGWTDAVATVAQPGARIRVPRDALAVPWRVRLVGSGPFAACGTS
jgi:hypothetical protein